MEKDTTISTLHQLLDFNTQHFIVGEVHLQKALHSWIEKASAVKLKAVFQKYLEHIDHNIQSFEKFIDVEKMNLISNEHKVLNVLIEDADTKFNYCSDPEIKDACLLASVQVINHYKICAYGTAAAYANTLGLEEAGKLFKLAEINEKQIDDRLSQMAEFEINKKAASPIVLPN
jgi:ferritin-like metal-binding protein YciE